MADFKVDLVAVEERFWSGEAKLVVVQTTEGEIGIMAGHEPLLGQLVPDGTVSITTGDGQQLVAAVESGFISVAPSGVTVLAELAHWADDVDVTAAQAVLDSDASDAAKNGARAQIRAAQRAGVR